MKGREEILKVHGKKVKLSDDVDFSAIAKAAAGASGAELANMVNEAALHAVRNGRTVGARQTWKRVWKWSLPVTRRRIRS